MLWTCCSLLPGATSSSRAAAAAAAAAAAEAAAAAAEAGAGAGAARGDGGLERVCDRLARYKQERCARRACQTRTSEALAHPQPLCLCLGLCVFVDALSATCACYEGSINALLMLY